MMVEDHVGLEHHEQLVEERREELGHLLELEHHEQLGQGLHEELERHERLVEDHRILELVLHPS